MNEQILDSVFSVAGFVIGVAFPRFLQAVVLVSVVAVTSTAFMLGIDCFSRAGLKCVFNTVEIIFCWISYASAPRREFYAYNLGFWALFPNIDKFRISTAMQIELIALASIFIAGVTYQLARYRHEIFPLDRLDDPNRPEEEMKRRSQMTMSVDLSEWEKKYGNLTPSSSSPLITGSNQRDSVYSSPPAPRTPPISGATFDANSYLGALDFEPSDSRPRRPKPSPIQPVRPHSFGGMNPSSKLPTRPSSLALPRQLLESPSSPPAPTSPNNDNRRHTLIDLTSNSGIPDEQRREQKIWQSKRDSILGWDKVIVGNVDAVRKRLSEIPAAAVKKEVPQNRIMDFSELEEKKKKRLSMLV